MQNTLKNSSSCKFLLQYHFIFVCKYRRKVLSQRFAAILKEQLLEISAKYDFTIIVQETDLDHIHLMIESIPKIAPSMICRVLKQESTSRMWKLLPNHLKHFYRENRILWTDGYFVSTIGNVSEQTLKHYIENQG